MANEREDASFNDYLLAQVKAKDTEIASLKAEIAELQKQKGISSAREGLTFDAHTGIWTEKASGVHYCPTCLNQERRNPLKVERAGWRCTMAGHYFGNPDRDG
jgi:hypothetical protein